MTLSRPVLSTPSEWTCDVCGEPITNAAAGWLEWLTGPLPKRSHDANRKCPASGLRIVHYKNSAGSYERCKYDGQREWYLTRRCVTDNTLELFVGADGLTTLLSWLDPNNYYVFDRRELLEIIKRLHVPGYEQARHYFEAAIAEGVFEPNSLPGYHDQQDTAATIAWAESR